LAFTPKPGPAVAPGFLLPERKDTRMNPTQDTLDLVMGALRTPDDRIAKTISTGTGLVPLHRDYDSLAVCG
jgi:hypothetical protein